MINLKDFAISAERGFLPAEDPLSKSSYFYQLVPVSADLPKLIASRQVHKFIKDFSLNLPAKLNECEMNEIRYAARVLSFLAHSYIWENPAQPSDSLPANLALPWYQIMCRLRRPPVLSYASYALDNWRRLDAGMPVELNNIVLQQNFLGGQDEEWFVLIHVDIEAKAGVAIAGLLDALYAASVKQPDKVIEALKKVAVIQEQMNSVLLRMTERCDPYIYFNRVRPYIHGWKNEPALPGGIIYEGVPEFGGKPQKFRGETGAQSTIIPSFDAALGVVHRDDPLVHYLHEMRQYMPPEHRDFLAALEALNIKEDKALLPAYIGQHKKALPELWQAFACCVKLLAQFRRIHYDYANQYIYQQSGHGKSNSTDIGTGGTPFMRYLKKHLDETQQLLDG